MVALGCQESFKPCKEGVRWCQEVIRGCHTHEGVLWCQLGVMWYLECVRWCQEGDIIGQAGVRLVRQPHSCASPCALARSQGWLSL